MIEAAEATEKLSTVWGRVKLSHGSTYRDNSTAVIVPTRGKIAPQVVLSWLNLIAPRNASRFLWMRAGDEVADSYNALVSQVLADPVASQWPYLLTLEDDCIVPPDAHLRLLEVIEEFDVVSGVYWTKTKPQVPCAFGDPNAYIATGRVDFEPADLRCGGLVPVLGVGMGCTLFRLDLFRELPEPWFRTRHEVEPEPDGPMPATQDLYWCKRLVKAGKRLAIDTRVCVEHMGA